MSAELDIDAVSKKLKSILESISDSIPEETVKALLKELDSENPAYWEIANTVGNYYNDHHVSDKVRNACRAMIDEIRLLQGRKAETDAETTTVVFGTSGWRGVIGEDFTVLNVHKVVRGIIEMMKTEEFLKTNSYNTFDDVRNHGILLLRDNRFMGETFTDAAIKELARAGIRIYKAGECPTGVGSALVTQLGAAGSINFTPSHNPMEYAGIKFNPADGGPADKNLTVLIEDKANAYMTEDSAFRPANNDYSSFIENVDAARLFERFIQEKSSVFNLDVLRGWLEKNRNELYLVIDYMHGSSRGYVETLLGEDLIRSLKKSGSLALLNTEDDYSFHGVKPEPSAKNQAGLIKLLKENRRRFTLAVAMDPDADRIRYADADMDIDMNRFGAIAYAHLLDKGHRGAICSTLPSSDFALEIARANGYEVVETAVGFKHFREALGSGKVLLAFEESDGISVRGHTLEKCALAGFLLALDALSSKEKTLSEQYRALQETYGYYYPDKSGAEVKGISVEDWQAYKAKVLDILQHRLFKTGDRVKVGDTEKVIKEIYTTDGVKLIFDDKSWILLRPSGTEPKFRYYYEIVSDKPISDVRRSLSEYEQAASEILQQARTKADA